MKHSKIKNTLSGGFIWIALLILVFIVGFFYTQIQTASLVRKSFVKLYAPPSAPALADNTINKIFITTAPTSTPYVIKKPAPTDNTPWGTAQKIGEHTYTIKIGHDERMGTPNEIFNALNVYRQAHSKGQLQWDDKLAAYAADRANLFKSISSTDEHKGLNDYLDSQDGFVKLGFNRIGENSYFGGPLLGVHIIEWLFASSTEHDANQLDSEWSHVGVGITDISVNINFGGGKM